MTLDDLIKSDLTEAAVAAATAPVIGSRPYYISHRSVLAVCGLAAAEWIAAALEAQAPATAKVYMTPGDNDGSGGGLDVSDPGTQEFLGQLVAMSAAYESAPGLFTGAMRDALVALGEEKTYPYGRQYTVEEITARRDEAARAKLIARWQIAIAYAVQTVVDPDPAGATGVAFAEACDAKLAALIAADAEGEQA